VKEEVKTGNGGAQYDADHKWTVFNRLMSKAVDVQKRRNAKAEPEPKPSPLGFAAHSGPPGLGAGGRQQPGGRLNSGECDLCDGYKCSHKLDDASPCDVHSTNVTQARCKEIIDDPSYKFYVDIGRKRRNNEPLNFPQPTESQQAKLREYDQFKQSQRAAKGKGGYGRDTQMGRPPATCAHKSAPLTQQEHSKTCWTRAWRCCSRCALTLERNEEREAAQIAFQNLRAVPELRSEVSKPNPRRIPKPVSRARVAQ
jgi:hypothetical protein